MNGHKPYIQMNIPVEQKNFPALQRADLYMQQTYINTNQGVGS
jgi:hypothetical protein